jgi:HlyD family secretion protein
VRYLVRAFFLLLVAGGIAAGLVWAFWPRPVPVELTTVTRGPLRVTVDEDGKTRIKDRYVVAAPLAGNLLRITLDPGDEVVAGKTLLAVIEPPAPKILDAREVAQAEARVQTAEAALAHAEPAIEKARVERDYAESELARLRRLAKSQTISVDRLEEM